MMAPHWLDTVFEEPKSAAKALTSSRRFVEAIEKAQLAFRNAEEELAKEPKRRGSDPAQQARLAFLDAINAP